MSFSMTGWKMFGHRRERHMNLGNKFHQRFTRKEIKRKQGSSHFSKKISNLEMLNICFFLIYSVSAETRFIKLKLPRFEKLVGSEVDLTRPIAVQSENDCISLCRSASLFISPTRQYDSSCDSLEIYSNGKCSLNKIPTLEKFIVEKTGSRALSCTYLCQLMSDCKIVQTETKITTRMTYKTCSFFDGISQIQRTSLPVVIEIKRGEFFGN